MKGQGKNMKKRAVGKKRYAVIEYAGHYSVRDLWTLGETVMGDGVDTLLTPTGKSIRPGTERFRRMWERELNADPASTQEAYFPHEVR